MTSVYETENLKLKTLEVDASTEEPPPPAELKNTIYKVVANGIFECYSYLTQAQSMKNVRLVGYFNADLSIEKTKVLIYREQHGREIGTAR